MDYMNNHNRSRKVSSVLSPYHVPGNFPNYIVSPSPVRGTSFSGANEFKSGKFNMKKNSAFQNGDDVPVNKQLTDLIANSFHIYGGNGKRKETDEIDFSVQDNTILNILNKPNNLVAERKPSQFDGSLNSIMSPDFHKNRSFSIHSGNYVYSGNNPQDKNNKTGWDTLPNENHLQMDKNQGNSI